jgi:predicted metalloendopeptidase
MYPQSDEEEDMLRRYATSYVFAHELCHGFDSKGSQYDGEGYMKDWWAPSDKQKFEVKKQQMVDRFNELWAYEGQHANGEKTLGENMADLGGVRLSFELFKDLLVEKGYYGESYKHMLREYFMHYAQVWKENDRGLDGYVEQYKSDVHSSSANRVNGITRIMDEWYDLFMVKSGDNYVAPADRPHIW